MNIGRVVTYALLIFAAVSTIHVYQGYQRVRVRMDKIETLVNKELTIREIALAVYRYIDIHHEAPQEINDAVGRRESMRMIRLRPRVELHNGPGASGDSTSIKLVERSFTLYLDDTNPNLLSVQYQAKKSQP